MSKLIDQQVVIDAVEAMVDKSGKGEISGFYNAILERVIDKLIALLSAQPEIVRCKDCKNIWYSGMATINGVPIKIYKCDWWDNRVVSEKGFCYMAERKTDE